MFGIQGACRESFVIRIWRERDCPDWRGWVQHARSGEAVFVKELDELLAFVERRTGKLVGTVEKHAERESKRRLK